MTSPFVNHLWQSTLFAVVVGLLTIALRNSRASVRYWLWLSASLKFLMPFSLLVTMGSQFHWRTEPAAAPIALPALIEQIGRPFSAPASEPLLASAPALSSIRPAVLLCVWIGGFLFVVFSWTHQWRRFRAIVRSAPPMNIDAAIQIRLSPGRMEPGVFGIFRPVLLVPHGIMDHLSPAQWEAILAHELCHVRRRDT